jgi:cytochrome c
MRRRRHIRILRSDVLVAALLVAVAVAACVYWPEKEAAAIAIPVAALVALHLMARVMIRVAFALIFLLLLSDNSIADDPAAAELQPCKICHSLDKGGANRVGPNLFGVFGRKAGAAPGFNYSAEMKQSDIVWDDETMATYLRDPQAAIPGNHMPFPGIKDETMLGELVPRLKQATQ